MGKKNICPIKPYIRLHSQRSGKLPTKIKTPFSKKSNEEKKRCSHEFIPTDPEFINILEHFTAEEEYETQPVWEAYNMLEERERIVLRLLVIEKKSMKVAAPIIWKYIKSKKSFEETSEKNIQSTISVVKSRAILSLTKKLEELKKHFT